MCVVRGIGSSSSSGGAAPEVKASLIETAASSSSSQERCRREREHDAAHTCGRRVRPAACEARCMTRCGAERGGCGDACSGGGGVRERGCRLSTASRAGGMWCGAEVEAGVCGGGSTVDGPRFSLLKSLPPVVSRPRPRVHTALPRRVV